jgi:hypothetical protein
LGWLPVKSNNELIGVVLITEVGKVHLGVYFMPEAIGALIQFFWSGGEVRLRAEVQTQGGQGTIVEWWYTVHTQIVAGKVSTELVEDKGGKCGG